jgi:hypothetical protein
MRYRGEEVNWYFSNSKLHKLPWALPTREHSIWNHHAGIHLSTRLTGVKLNTWQLHDISLNSRIAFLDNDFYVPRY